MTRLNPYLVAQDQMNPLIAYAVASHDNGIEPRLQHLVRIRASQINGCAVCLNMHAAEARKDGETDARILLLDAWREAGIYTVREKAALAWTEALTKLSQGHIGDDLYAETAAQFSGAEMVALTLLIGNINTFNRIGAGFHVPPLGLKQAEAA